MNSVFLIGDSHLLQCYTQLKKDLKRSNFDEELVNCIWEFDVNHVKGIKPKFKELKNKHGVPKAVVLLCGGYDIRLNVTAQEIINNFKKTISYMNSNGVKYIVLCSIIERFDKTSPKVANQAVRHSNKSFARIYKGRDNILFINIRPPGNIKEFIIVEDTYHLKPESYRHLYNKLRTTLKERIFINFIKSNCSEDGSLSEQEVEMDSKEEECTLYIPAPSSGVNKRMHEFKVVLHKDFHRVNKELNLLKLKQKDIVAKLSAMEREKKDIQENYEKLFQENIENVHQSSQSESPISDMDC